MKKFTRTYMKSFFPVIFLFGAGLVQAQEKEGITFQHGLTWAQIKEKAKKENKYIFMDGFTTWCGPCKRMTAEIFPQPAVADFFNANFINVAVQFDITKKDNEEVRSWYKEASLLKKTYQIDSYPTYLFFNPEGQVVHRLDVAETAEEFIASAKKALDPGFQYFSLKRRYDAGEKEPAFLLSLIKAAQAAKERELLPGFINTYMATQKNLRTEENIKLLAVSTLKTTDPGFAVFRNHATETDRILGKNQSAGIVRTVLFDEIVLPVLRIDGSKANYGGGMIIYSGQLNEHVNWDELKAKLDAHYPEVSEEIILFAKIQYSDWQKDLQKFSESVTEFKSKYGHRLNTDQLLVYAWTILSNSDDKNCIGSAITWLKEADPVATKKKAFYTYTYANLVYKSGQKDEAIKILKDAELLGTVHSFLAILATRMEKGEKTW